MKMTKVSCRIRPKMETHRRRSSTAQVTLEYFILFAVIALVTLVSLTDFDDRAIAALTGFFQGAANQMAN